MSLPNMLDAKTYEGITWSEEVLATVSDGVPAWGKGQFSFGCACGLWALSLIGVAGMHRIYLGDCCMGVVCCLTAGGWGVGTLYDCCTLRGTVNRLNNEITSKVNLKNAANNNNNNSGGLNQTIIVSPQYAQSAPPPGGYPPPPPGGYPPPPPGGYPPPPPGDYPPPPQGYPTS